MNLFMLLAEKTEAAEAQNFQVMMMAGLLAFVVFILLNGRSQRKKEQKQREDLLNNLSKNQRIATIGGIVGTIVAVKDDEVVVKVDETTNTKMTFQKSAIRGVVGDQLGVGAS